MYNISNRLELDNLNVIFMDSGSYEFMLDNKIDNKTIADIFNYNNYQYEINNILSDKFTPTTIYKLNEINLKTKYMLGIDEYKDFNFSLVSDEEKRYVKQDIDLVFKENPYFKADKYYEIINTPEGVFILFKKGFYQNLLEDKDNISSLLKEICKTFHNNKLSYSKYLNAYLKVKSNLFNLNIPFIKF